MGNPTPPFDDDEFLRGLPRQGDARVVGPVKLQARISKGGMGVVYRGRHLKLDIDVAVKFLLPHLVQNNPEYLLRFEREARFAAQLNNENLVRVFDVDSEDGYHYVVMELVCGETARDRVARKGPLAEAEAMAIILGATRGLEAAHRKSIVHRDIKPENIMIDTSGIVKLADLGIAKVRDDPERTQSVVTQPGAIIGTPAFMAPEQVQSAHEVCPAVDIYSMGATLYFLLTGKVPFDGTLLQVLHAIGSGFPDVRKERPRISERVLRILNRCTALEPAARYPDAGALLRDIDRSAAQSTSLAEDGMGTVRAEARVSTPPRQHLGEIRLAVTENERAAPSTASLHGRWRAALVVAAAFILCGSFATGGYLAFRELARPRRGEAMARAPAANEAPGAGEKASASAAPAERTPEPPLAPGDADDRAAPSMATTAGGGQLPVSPPEVEESPVTGSPATEAAGLDEPESSSPAGREAAPAEETRAGEEIAAAVVEPPPASPRDSPADSAPTEAPAPGPRPEPEPAAVAETIPPPAEPAADFAWAEELASAFQIEAAQAAGLPLAREIRLAGDVALRFLYVPPGELQRGAPAAAAKATLTKGFYLAVHEVTWEVFLAVAGGAPRGPAAVSAAEPGKLPVTNVSWEEAGRFCGSLSELVSARGAPARFRLFPRRRSGSTPAAPARRRPIPGGIVSRKRMSGAGSTRRVVRIPPA